MSNTKSFFFPIKPLLIKQPRFQGLSSSRPREREEERPWDRGCLLQTRVGHFPVDLNLIMKARLSAKFLLQKLVFIHMQTKLIFI